jgi:hypothetical protein
MSGCFWEPSVLGSSPILNTQTVVYLISDLVSLGAQVKKQLMPSCRNILSNSIEPSAQPRISTLFNMAAWALQAGVDLESRVWELVGDNSSLANESNEAVYIEHLGII